MKVLSILKSSFFFFYNFFIFIHYKDNISHSMCTFNSIQNLRKLVFFFIDYIIQHIQQSAPVKKQTNKKKKHVYELKQFSYA